jgi:hypothetical protein
LGVSLYKDRERAVLTELCSNALDAHKMVGKQDLPIQITMPSSLSAEVRVRDFGPGLSESDVYSLLTTFGASSKGDSNDFVGGFGIGSKSPAAVTDTWTINSYHAGSMTSYLVHINDRGVPSINNLFSKLSDETGIEVVIPTKLTKTWSDAAKKVFAHYAVYPNILGDKHNSYTKHKFDFEFHNLAKFTSDEPGYFQKVVVIMNHRDYLIDMSKIKDTLSFDKTIYLPFDISSLPVSLSREDLQYSQSMIAAIEQRYADIKIKLCEGWDANVAIHTDLVEYQQAAAKFKSEHFLTATSCGYIASASTLDTMRNKVDFDYLSTYKIELTEKEYPVQYGYKGSVSKLKTESYAKGYNHISTRSYSSKSYSSKIYFIRFTAKNKDDICFVCRDDKRTLTKVKNAGLVTGMYYTVILDKEWFDLIPDCFNKVKASSLVCPPVVKRKPKVKAESEIYRRDRKSFYTVGDESLDKTKDIVCIKVPNIRTSDSIVDSFERKFSEFSSKNKVCTVIYVKEKSTVPSYTITAKEFVTKQYDLLYADKQMYVDVHNKNIVEGESTYYMFGILLKEENLKINPISVIGKIRMEVKRLLSLKLTKSYDPSIINTYANMLSKPLVDIVGQDFKKMSIDTYPMLEFCLTNYMTDKTKIDNIVDYINLVGK